MQRIRQHLHTSRTRARSMPMSIMRRSTCSLGCEASGSGTSAGGGGVGDSGCGLGIWLGLGLVADAVAGVGDVEGRCGDGDWAGPDGPGDWEDTGEAGCGEEQHGVGVGDGDGEGRATPDPATPPADDVEAELAARTAPACFEVAAVTHGCAATSFKRRRRAGSTCSIRRIRFSHSARAIEEHSTLYSSLHTSNKT